MASIVSHLACSNYICHNLVLRRRLARDPKLHLKAEITTSNKGYAVKRCASNIRTTLSCSAQPSTPYTEDFTKPHSAVEENGSVYKTSETENQIPIQEKKFAKIHDFCFGIPFGSTILIGGLVGFIFSRNVSTLYNGVLSGGALLALSTTSLKIWRQGKSSFPFILGQAVISVAVMWNNYQSYLLTKKIFPTAFYAAISAAMLCFYSYVVISGGNPPPKKLKSSATAS
uniref:Protein FATTY ACID EXPORT 1, chloroplastic n=1 Tax=Kalanchoe fedtschenkoi TaxID=63787 RepID=A0A7N0RCW1_KALFE